MLVQYLVLLGATDLRKAKIKVSRLSILFRLTRKATSRPFVSGKLLHRARKNTFYDNASGQRRK